MHRGGRRSNVSIPTEDIVVWAAKTFGDGLVMSTSFGIQAAVMLHLVTQVVPRIPVIWIDTGYFPAQTYLFAEKLTERLGLNLKVYQSALSPARMETLYGKLWEVNDINACNCYDQIRKIEPMQRALQELQATAWLAGVRKEHIHHRQLIHRIYIHANCYKVLPILNWQAQDIYEYLQTYGLPYHPFFELGYTTVGDWHASHAVRGDDTCDGFGHRSTSIQEFQDEDGSPLPHTPQEFQSLDSSCL
nr:phosphoadenylyl-sulfate reductase [Acaryochloris sp. IP29b_bin.148]